MEQTKSFNHLTRPRGEERDAMKPKITVIDNRSPPSNRAFSFASFNAGTIISPLAHPDTIWMRTSDTTGLKLVGDSPGSIQFANPEFQCFERPEIQIEIIIKNSEPT